MEKEPEEKIEERGQVDRITPNQLFLLSKTIREYREMLEKKEENLMSRHKLKLYQEFIGLILAKGIDEVIDYYREQKLNINLKNQIMDEEMDEGF